MFNSFQSLKEEIEKIRNVVFVVEGIKDRNQLRKLGFEKIFTISGKPLFSIVEKIKREKLNEVVVLTDFDDEGEKKAKELTRLLQRNSIFVNQKIRNSFKSLFNINKVEELAFLTKLMGDGCYEITSINGKILNRSRILMRRNCRKTRCHRSSFWSDRRFTRSRS
jgi:5S rRNA maturation endonuclease (ribonuclease M5)